MAEGSRKANHRRRSGSRAKSAEVAWGTRARGAEGGWELRFPASQRSLGFSLSHRGLRSRWRARSLSPPNPLSASVLAAWRRPAVIGSWRPRCVASRIVAIGVRASRTWRTRWGWPREPSSSTSDPRRGCSSRRSSVRSLCSRRGSTLRPTSSIRGSGPCSTGGSSGQRTSSRPTPSPTASR
jgi:hypothetical protein